MAESQPQAPFPSSTTQYLSVSRALRFIQSPQRILGVAACEGEGAVDPCQGHSLSHPWPTMSSRRRQRDLGWHSMTLPILPQVKLASWSREKPGGWYSTFRRGKKVGSNADMEDSMCENWWELAWVDREGQALLYKVLGSVPSTE